MPRKILVTGGAGYIGSTICWALEDAGHTPVVLDSLVTGQKAFTKGRIFYHGDIANRALVEQVFKEHSDIYAVVHCAALIVVPESAERPFDYYTCNVSNSMSFLNTLREYCHRVVFSSSASVYGNPPDFCAHETTPLAPASPYARSKAMFEMILADFCSAYGMQAISLRYFNPVGADPKLRSGVHVRKPSHVLGKLVDVACGKIPHFEITGTDWPTRDGTGLRDYIHVWDLANAHVAAIEKFESVFQTVDASPATFAPNVNSYRAVNLGTGLGTTVRELVSAFQKATGKNVPVVESPRREGDVAGAFASAQKASALLHWKCELSLEQAIAHALAWAEKREHVLGYR